jgi:hypothetical protein
MARKPLVSVLTATIPGREHLLKECKASVKAQTYKPVEHLIGLDEDGVGCARMVNGLASAAAGDWLFLIADDDIMLPRCLELLVGASGQGPVVYSPPLVWGEDAAQFRSTPPNIPSSALIGTEFWRKLGGYNEDLSQAEDNEFWRRAEQRGITFVRFDTAPTWVYRFHGDNKSRS